MSLSLAIWSRALSALERASRVTSERGISPLKGCSSIEEGRKASGSMPTWPSKVRRRGEALASTSLGLSQARRPVGLERASSRLSVSRRGLSVRLSALIRAALVEVMLFFVPQRRFWPTMPTGCGGNQAGGRPA
jgi:hypothetical protein